MASTLKNRPIKRNRKSKAAKRKKWIILISLEVVILLLLGCVSYGVSLISRYRYESVDEDALYRPSFEKQTNADGETSDDSDTTDYEEVLEGYTNIAVLGVDDGGTNADVMIICSINNQTKEVKMASVYRDTYWLMPDGETYEKANSALTVYGKMTDVLSMLNMNLDIIIDEYVVVNWAAVARAVDMLGGVEVEITDEILTKGQLNGYITDVVKSTGLASTQISEPGTYVLDGVQTVAYSRIRYIDSDVGRTQRQREVIEKMLVKAKEASLGTLIELVKEILPNITSSLSQPEILGMATNVASYQIIGQTGFPQNYETAYRVGNITLPNSKNWPLVPKTLESCVIELHEFLYGKENYVPSKKVQEISKHIEEVSGVTLN